MEYIILKTEENWHFINASDENETIKQLKFNKLAENDLLITCQISELIFDINKEQLEYINIIDFECLDKQLFQEGNDSKRDLQHWNPIDMMKHYLQRDDIDKEYNNNFFLIPLTRTYNKLKQMSPLEWDRINCIELPINRILYRAQSNGIKTKANSEIINDCNLLYRDIYKLKNQIQIEYGQTIPDIDAYLKKNNISNLRVTLKDLEVISKSFPGVKPYYELMKKEKDLRSLLYISSNRDDILHPVYKGFGTSTSRIMLRQPSLQNLSREYRKYILPIVENKKYVYIDYGQFEAGILIGLTGQEKLQKLYDTDSIYETLRIAMNCSRDEAKKHFYHFLYGGSYCNASAFFLTYIDSKVIEEKKTEAFKKGYISSQFGNMRKIIDYSKTNWTFNHLIQSNASYIFKLALLEVEKKYKEQVNLVLPMHDAALYKVDNYFDDKNLIQCFIDAFKKVFPKIEPKVKIKDFLHD